MIYGPDLVKLKLQNGLKWRLGKLYDNSQVMISMIVMNFSLA